MCSLSGKCISDIIFKFILILQKSCLKDNLKKKQLKNNKNLGKMNNYSRVASLFFIFFFRLAIKLA